jgi:hypothetical protein
MGAAGSLPCTPSFEVIGLEPLSLSVFIILVTRADP